MDAGTHLTAIIKILELYTRDSTERKRPITLTEGPFKGLQLPHFSSSANAAHITRTLVDTYLITHPHLDHISGFVVNTVIPGSRPQRLAALPATIEAFKSHIFNNVIWPNLSDENNGVGLVTYMRLVEGGSPAIGEGEARGYVEISEGLSVKTWGVSHGHCIENHSHRGSNAGILTSIASPQVDIDPHTRTRANSQLQLSPRSSSRGNLQPNTGGELLRSDSGKIQCVYTSSAYFIRDISTGKEVLIFGDVEPDSLSLSPRNRQVWRDAAPKIASGRLPGIFIECSFEDSQSDETLFGHLAPRHLIDELKVLSAEVEHFKSREARNRDKENKKRKHSSSISSSHGLRKSPRRQKCPGSRSMSPIPVNIEVTQADGAVIDEQMTGTQDAARPLPIHRFDTLPLRGVKVVIIHIKDKLDDGPDSGDMILQQLLEYEEEAKLGCEFVISRAGMAVYL